MFSIPNGQTEQISKLIVLNFSIPIFLFLFNKMISFGFPNFFSLLKGQINDIKQKINNKLIYARWFYFLASFLVMYGVNFGSGSVKNNETNSSFDEIIIIEDDELLVGETVKYIETNVKDQSYNEEQQNVLTVEYFKNAVIFNGLETFVKDKSDDEIQNLKAALSEVDANRIVKHIDSTLTSELHEISDSLYYTELDELNLKLYNYILTNKEKIAGNTM